ncbi:hypothetical protein GCM10022252_48150 [Streptosporangium oxazolinicum]|uniref:Histidine kinase/HSP90-like ATPase domain-containing protein n=1 Tax=Streptosporangium oxazolinicum TaxID=909287 RepID=A0ABP8B5F4_9ACTN
MRNVFPAAERPVVVDLGDRVAGDHPTRAGYREPPQCVPLALLTNPSNTEKLIRLGVLDTNYQLSVWVLESGSVARGARSAVRQALRAASIADDEVSNAESIVAELGANAEIHAEPPYELRILSIGEMPMWCEVVDGDRDPATVSIILGKLHQGETEKSPDAETGRGLPLAYLLSQGRCRTYPTRIFSTNQAGKAIAFALPTRSG